jgi:pyruvate dehydrogenase E1 component beta subunit
MAKKRLIQAINEALFEEMERDPRVILFGEDVKISLFGDTRGLAERFGEQRVRNTPISETVMTGMAVGAAAAGYRVVCHMMFGNFLYTGFDAMANRRQTALHGRGADPAAVVYMAVMGAGRQPGPAFGRAVPAARTGWHQSSGAEHTSRRQGTAEGGHPR